MKAAVAALAAVLVLAGQAAAATPTETKWIDKKDGFSVILPAKWYPVPRTVTAVRQTIATLKKQKKTALANEYSFYLTTPGKAQLKDFVFQAFLDIAPSTDPIAPQFAVQKDASRKYKTGDLPAAGRAYASALASHKGAKITVPKSISLVHAGKAQFVTGSIPAGPGLADGFELYLLVHGGKLYALKFDIDATALSQAHVFRSIADHFAWT